MAQAIVVSMKRADEALEVAAYSPSGTRAEALAHRIGGSVLDRPQDLGSFDLVLIGCKPQQFGSLCRAGWGFVEGQTAISIMAGVPISVIKRSLGLRSVVRTMPNTPASVDHGVTLAVADACVVLDHFSWFAKVWRTFCELFILDDEADIDRITPVSGSGPALLFEWARLMQRYLEAQGIAAEKARRIVVHTSLGSAKLMECSGLPFERLREDVTSPKGTTFEALEELERSGFGGAVARALERARQRAVALGRELGREI